MNFEQMSDFEINQQVGNVIGLATASEPVFKQVIRNSNGKEFDPCNSWADAGPIIVENKISLSNAIIRWNASSLVYDDKFDAGFKIYRSNSGVDSSNRGALRAAMIVFLMMKEQKCSN